MDSEVTESAGTTELCRQMHDVRCSLSEDVEEMVDSAHTLAEWQYYVREHPWICLGGAAAVGFLLVPTRIETISPSAEVLEQLAKRNKLVVKPNLQPRARGGIGGAMLEILAKAAVRGAIGYLEGKAGRFLDDEHRNRGGEDAEPNQ